MRGARCLITKQFKFQFSLANPLGHETFFAARHYADSIRLKTHGAKRSAWRGVGHFICLPPLTAQGFAVRMISACKPPRVRSF